MTLNSKARVSQPSLISMQTNFTGIPRIFMKRRKGFNFNEETTQTTDSGIKIFSVLEFYRKVNLDLFKSEVSALFHVEAHLDAEESTLFTFKTLDRLL